MTLVRSGFSAGKSKQGRLRFFSKRNEATELRNSPDLKRENFARQLGVKGFNVWAVETYGVAIERAYLKGDLTGSKNRENGEALPDGYPANAKKVAESQIVLAGYRISDVLGEMFGQ